MKVRFILLLLSSSYVSAQKQSPPAELHIASLNWLVGSWERINVKEGFKAQETWKLSGQEELAGVGVTLKGTDTVFVEKIRILKKDQDLFYVADVKENSKPIYFKFTTMHFSGFSCENPEHDFPKKIEYNLQGKNLTVVISGDGKSQNFTFVRN